MQNQLSEKEQNINISIILIGKNVEKTLKSCVDSIFKSIKNTKYIDKYEIIYIDSCSIDKSINISKELGINYLEISESFTSASLGRYLGIKYSKYDNILFMDADMELDSEWFNSSYNTYLEYKAITGERYEKLYKNNIIIKEIPNFYNIKHIEEGNNIGGCFMIDKKIIQNNNFSPILLEEEERDFYSKFYINNKIYKVPIQMFIHNNYNLSGKRFVEYFIPHKKIGYILSFFSSIKHGYSRGYVELQSMYMFSMLSSLIFYIGIFSSNFLLISISIVVLVAFNRKQFKGSLMTMLFFPYKFLISLFYFKKNYTIKYKYLNKDYVEVVKI